MSKGLLTSSASVQRLEQTVTGELQASAPVYKTHRSVLFKQNHKLRGRKPESTSEKGNKGGEYNQGSSLCGLPELEVTAASACLS